MRRTVLTCVIALSAVSAVYGQQVISIKAGLVHYAEGEVLLEGKRVDPKIGNFPEMKENALLQTQRGRVEVLLGPGMFLRMSEDSQVRMLNNALTATEIEFIEGSALIEIADLGKENALRIRYKNTVVTPDRTGIYRFDTEPSAQLRVFEGRAEVVSNDQTVEVKKGRLMLLDGTLQVAKFDPEIGDSLHRWSSRRAGYLAMANVSAATTLRTRGYDRLSSAGWMYNPWFGMFTYIPMDGRMSSPFGYYFYSPYSVYQLYQRPVFNSPSMSAGRADRGFNSNLGYSTSDSRSYGGYGSSAPSSPSSAPAASAPVDSSPRSAPSATGRSGAGGGRGQ